MPIREYYQKNKEHLRKYGLVYQREWNRKNPRKDVEQYQKYLCNPQNAAKAKVRGITTRAIKSGLLFRLPCEICGDDKAEAHHDDYSQPLEVRWLCKLHHAEHHTNLRKEYK